MNKALAKSAIGKTAAGGVLNVNGSLLIIDDSPMIVDRLRELLEDVARISEIRWCYSYSDAILTIDNFRPNIILLDINLAGLSGLDLLRYIKTYLLQTIVIMVSNQSSEYYKQICEELGADYFVDKAKDFYTIPDIVTSCLSSPSYSITAL